MSGPQGCGAALAALAVSVALTIWKPALGAPLVAVALVLCWLALKRASGTEKAAFDAASARLAAVGTPTGDVWRRLLELENLGDIVDVVAAHVRTAVRLSTRPTDEVELGRSRVGGTPDLPVDVTWPRHNGVPLAFLAQIDLAEASAADAVPLPRTGHLWFFCDAANWDFSTPGSAVVLYRAGTAELRRVSTPADLPESSRFKSCAITLEYYEDLPDTDDAAWLTRALHDDEGRIEAYEELREYLNAPARAASPHKLLGFANTIQGAMQGECGPPADDHSPKLRVSRVSRQKRARGSRAAVPFGNERCSSFARPRALEML